MFNFEVYISLVCDNFRSHLWPTFACTTLWSWLAKCACLSGFRSFSLFASGSSSSPATFFGTPKGALFFHRFRSERGAPHTNAWAVLWWKSEPAPLSRLTMSPPIISHCRPDAIAVAGDCNSLNGKDLPFPSHSPFWLVEYLRFLSLHKFWFKFLHSIRFIIISDLLHSFCFALQNQLGFNQFHSFLLLHVFF